jgi:hypothetical protein
MQTGIPPQAAGKMPLLFHASQGPDCIGQGFHPAHKTTGNHQPVICSARRHWQSSHFLRRSCIFENEAVSPDQFQKFCRIFLDERQIHRFFFEFIWQHQTCCLPLIHRQRQYERLALVASDWPKACLLQGNHLRTSHPGGHLYGYNAGETINIFAMAIKFGLNNQDLKKVLWAHSTTVSDLKYMLD